MHGERMNHLLLWTAAAALILQVLFVHSGCDEGLKPDPPRIPMGSFSGLMVFEHWPSPDSLFDLRLVAFRDFPPTDILSEVLGGRAYVYPSLGDTATLPFFVDSTRYIVTIPIGRYEYIVIAQRFGPSLTTDWRAVGQYDLDSNLAVPSPLTIVENDTLQDINIYVDFSNPPPPPLQ
jgi:hypothetical protein